MSDVMLGKTLFSYFFQFSFSCSEGPNLSLGGNVFFFFHAFIQIPATKFPEFSEDRHPFYPCDQRYSLLYMAWCPPGP